MSDADARGYTSAAEPAQPADRTPSDAAVAALVSLPTIEYLTPEQAAIAWIDHLRKGGAPPDGHALADLLHALVASRVPRPQAPMASLVSGPAVRMVLVDTEPKFPHMRDRQQGRLTYDEAIWTQCKTKMTHICVRLIDPQGNPVKGSDIQEGGLVLRLTLHKVSDFADTSLTPMDDSFNPRPKEGLFLGRASNAFEPEVCLMEEGRHEFRFQVMLLSSDIAGARMFVKVSPVDPQLALNPNLTVHSRSFASRARMPDEYAANRAKRTRAAAHLLGMAMDLAEAEASDAHEETEIDT